MSNSITSGQMKFIVEKLLDNATDAVKESKTARGEEKVFYDGMKQAYHEMLDTMKNQLIVDDQDLEKFGLNIDLEDALA